MVNPGCTCSIIKFYLTSPIWDFLFPRRLAAWVPPCGSVYSHNSWIANLALAVPLCQTLCLVSLTLLWIDLLNYNSTNHWLTKNTCHLEALLPVPPSHFSCSNLNITYNLHSQYFLFLPWLGDPSLGSKTNYYLNHLCYLPSGEILNAR